MDLELQTREHRIQQKLQMARERMREFKKKLALMKVFLNKYENRAIQRGSMDIYKAVSVLLKEQIKHKYLLNEEESEILSRMKLFLNQFRMQNIQCSLGRDEYDTASQKENIRLDSNKIKPFGTLTANQMSVS